MSRGVATSKSQSQSMVVAIDGPAGAGKSTVAREVAERLGVTVLDTGAMYRATTLACLNAGIDLHDSDACAKVGAAASIVLADDGTVTLDGVDVTRAIRTPEVTAAVSIVSAHPQVRAIMVGHQRAWAERHTTAVVEGRDIGTVVFQDAAVKVFLMASGDERARRRLRDEERHGRSPTLADLQSDIARRDALDSERAVSPLRPADDAILIDTTGRTIDDVVDQVLARFEAVS